VPVDWPLVTGTLGTVGALLIALAAVLMQRRNEHLYQGLIFTGAFLIFIGFLFQILPYIAKEQGLLIARWITIALFLAGVIFAIVRYGCRRPKKNTSKSAKKPK
jgi:cbb3-type cytochrome oxidase subunit 1